VTARRPGEWPDGTHAPLAEADDQGARHLALVAEQARFHVTLGAIRADLEVQPSPRSIRAAVRRWHEAITNAGEELIAQRRRAG
jgi:hypothetical protein